MIPVCLDEISTRPDRWDRCNPVITWGNQILSPQNETFSNFFVHILF